MIANLAVAQVWRWSMKHSRENNYRILTNLSFRTSFGPRNSHGENSYRTITNLSFKSNGGRRNRFLRPCDPENPETSTVLSLCTTVCTTQHCDSPGPLYQWSSSGTRERSPYLLTGPVSRLGHYWVRDPFSTIAVILCRRKYSTEFVSLCITWRKWLGSSSYTIQSQSHC